MTQSVSPRPHHKFGKNDLYKPSAVLIVIAGVALIILAFGSGYLSVAFFGLVFLVIGASFWFISPQEVERREYHDS